MGPLDMHTNRIRLVLLVVLLGLGIVAGQALSRARTTDDRREADLQARFADAQQVLDPTTPLVSLVQTKSEFWERWWDRVEPEDRPFCDELRARLELYLDLMQAEYADAAEIYTSGRLPEGLSETARALRVQARQRLGPEIEETLAGFDTLRNTAYRVSPEHGGLDPDLRDLTLENHQLRTWLPEARSLVIRLTEPPDSQTER